MTVSTELTAIIAVAGEPQGLDGWLDAWLDAACAPSAELIFCVAGAVPPQLRTPPPGVRVVTAPPGTLVPILWRDGIAAAHGTRVALTTDRFAASAAWLAAVAAADLKAWVAVGGTIACRHGSALRWAVYFLRFSRFTPPAVAHAVAEIAADNAVYRRADILAHADLLAAGFWEPSFHARFRAAGLRLALDPALVSLYCGCDRPGEFMAHRFAHGREFGRTRAAAVPRRRRIALLAAAPLVPFVLIARIAAAAGRRPGMQLPLLGALGWLTLFCAAWSVGEARGTAETIFATHSLGKS